MKKKVEKKQEKISELHQLRIPGVPKAHFELTVGGNAGYIPNPFTFKAVQAIIDKQSGVVNERQFRDLDKECNELLEAITIPGKKMYGVPARNIKNAAVTAAKRLNDKSVPSTRVKASFFVIGTFGEWVPINHKSKPIFHLSVPRVGNGMPMPVKRPLFQDWSITFKIMYDPTMITPETIVNLYERAGFAVGLGAWRPECNGEFGTFSVKRG